MFDNNLIFSFILSFTNTLIYYLFNKKKDLNNKDTIQELLIVFGITFALCFFMKSLSSSEVKSIVNKPSGDVILTQSTRPPF